jgi:prepilin-type N-terminal cleavage/methylation domain-containing protein
MYNKKDVCGFTLIELLVVISIIGILSSFAVVSLNTARIKARDALRKGDMAQLRTALYIYYDDNLAYPSCGTWDEGEADYGATVGNNNGDGSWCYINTLETALTSGSRPYVGKMPRDPKNQDNDADFEAVYIYRYVSDGIQFALVYTLEDGGMQVSRGW